jgi:prepilin-type N-terminal cleavage/methylation domain-containing protein
MKSFHFIARCNYCGRCAGYTLVEVMIASAISALIMGPIIILYVFAARSSQGLNRQLEMNSNARVMNLMLTEIRSAQSVSIRNYDQNTFRVIAPGTPQCGNALLLTIYDASNTSRQVAYWLSNSNLFRSTVNGSDGRLWLSNITNATPFSAQDYSGAVLSNLIDRVVVDVNLGVMEDSNSRDFRQTLAIHTAGTKRN